MKYRFDQRLILLGLCSILGLFSCERSFEAKENLRLQVNSPVEPEAPLSPPTSAVSASNPTATDSETNGTTTTSTANALPSSTTTQTPQASSFPSSQNKRFRITREVAVFELISKDLLQFSFSLKTGSEVELDSSIQPEPFLIARPNQEPARSSTGFQGPINFIKVSHDSITLEQLKSTNKKYYVSSSVFDSASSLNQNETFSALPDLNLKEDYLKSFNPTGRPKRAFTSGLVRRFGTQLNRGVALSSLSTREQVKWSRIYRELVKVADRTESKSPRSLLFTQQEQADALALDFEKNRLVPTTGAWSIAVNATAKREGFSNVPCAEFMSEVIRQAYRRANFSIFEDFNSEKQNELHFSNTASVQGLGQALKKAGWIPWDMASFKPPVGAVIMHSDARSPGHTYMSAGKNGRFILDNGSPSGRDLGQSSDYAINLMYRHGAFFLPPGIQPIAW